MEIQFDLEDASGFLKGLPEIQFEEGHNFVPISVEALDGDQLFSGIAHLYAPQVGVTMVALGRVQLVGVA